MKRPQHMTMTELMALPVVGGEEPMPPAHGTSYVLAGDIYGVAFEDDFGCAWGTVHRACGWMRYPLRSGRRQSAAIAPAIRAFFAARRAPLGLHA